MVSEAFSLTVYLTERRIWIFTLGMEIIMELLFEIDLHDYELGDNVFSRPSARELTQAQGTHWKSPRKQNLQTSSENVEFFWWCFFMLKRQQELNFSPYVDLYEKLIPKDHIFRRINELVDFSFIEEELEKNIVRIMEERQSLQSECLNICF